MRFRALAAVASVSLVAIVAACGEPASSDFDDVPGRRTGSDGGASGGGFGNGGEGNGSSGGGETCAATAAATEKPPVDIIFSIDNSGSMGEEMAEVQRNVNTFAQKIGGTGLDYRVVFVVKKGRGGPSGGAGNVGGLTICVPEPLAGPGCSDKLPTFRHVDYDMQSNNVLADLPNIWNQPDRTWRTTLRPEAFKVFVLVSDDGQREISAQQFDAKLLALDPTMFGTEEARRYVVHSICPWKEGTPVEAYDQQCPSASGDGRAYRDIAKLTGGIVDSVCKADYSSTLDNLAKGIVDRLACELKLPSAAAADPGKVAVRTTTPAGVTNLEQVTDVGKCAQFPNGWYYDDPAKPTRILLCKTACDAVSATAGSKVEALVGCKTAGPR